MVFCKFGGPPNHKVCGGLVIYKGADKSLA